MAPFFNAVLTFIHPFQIGLVMNADLRVGPEAKAATPTGAISLAEILTLFRRLRPRVVVGTRE